MNDDTTRSNPPYDPLIGKLLNGRYLVQRLLARGGMGKVYVARQEPLGRACALKVVDVPGSGEEFDQRFHLEASALARLSHPNTV